MPLVALEDICGNWVKLEDLERTYNPQRWDYDPLPYLLFLARRKKPYPEDVHSSATQLTRPLQIRILDERHKYACRPQDLAWRSFGSAVHVLMEHQQLNTLAEERIYVEVNGYKVGMQPDLYDNWKILTDFKTTSIFKYQLVQQYGWAQWPEVRWQLSQYKVGFQNYGWRVTRLQVKVFCRDWHRTGVHAAYYPQRQDPVLALIPHSRKETISWMHGRIASYEQVKDLPDHQLPECTSEERWERPHQWAVKREGTKRAYRLLDSEEAAKKLISEMGKKGKSYKIEERPGESVRCEHFCDLRPFCQQYKRMKEADHDTLCKE